MDLGLENEKSNVTIRINSVCQFSVNMENSDFFWLKFAQKWTLRSEFQKSKSRFGISTSKIPCVPIFNQSGQLQFFSAKNLRKLPNYLQHFGSNNLEGVVESWVEADMSWVETEMGWMELGGTRWRWMDLGGAGGGWFWVEVGARFSNTRLCSENEKNVVLIIKLSCAEVTHKNFK